MSGRDFRSLLSQQRSRGNCSSHNKGALLHSLLSGSRRKIPINKLNYDLILENIAQVKQTGDYQVTHMRTLSKRGKDAQEQNILKQHHEIWHRENKIVEELLIRTQRDLENWQTKATLDSKLSDSLHDIYQYHLSLSFDRKQFEDSTVQSICRLRAKVASCRASEVEVEIVREMERVKEELSQSEQQLKEEYDTLTIELQEEEEEEEEERVVVVVKGVPPELVMLQYPSGAVRQHVMDELQRRDEKYETQVNCLEEERKVINLVRPQWSVEDDFHIRTVIQQYHSASPHHRRALCIDRLIRGLPHKTRDELVSYEEWLRASAHNIAKRKLTVATWIEAKADITQYLVGVINESWLEVERKRMSEQDREEQLYLCQELSEKVSQWHQHKQEIERQQAEQAKIQRAALDEAARKEMQERDKRKRRVRDKVAEYHQAQEVQRHEEEEVYQQQVRKWTTSLEEQGKWNKERIEYREGLLVTKQQQQIQAAQEEKEEERKKEERLESIRAQVRVIVDSNLSRATGDTMATRARMTHQESELQQPLFPLHSYTADKVTGDPRFKVAAALRNAGLLSTDYARQVLSRIPPPLPPRRDMTSSLFKQQQQ